MDAHAHLLSLGWAGPGHSLDSRPHKGKRGLAYDPKQAQSNGNGLIKPLLVSQKKNTFGVGKKAHEPAAGNEWWLKGFESALSNIGKSESERTSGSATPVYGPNTSGYIGKHAGLYGFFVKGGHMEGTIGSDFEEKTKVKKERKRKSDALEDQEEDSSASDHGRHSSEKRSKTKRKSKDAAADFELVGAFLDARDKDRKRKQKKEKTAAAEEFQQAAEYFEARSARRKKDNAEAEAETAVMKVKVDEKSEQERRRRRKERKAAKRAKALQSEGDSVDSSDAAAIAKAARRAERNRRKGLRGEMMLSLDVA